MPSLKSFSYIKKKILVTIPCLNGNKSFWKIAATYQWPVERQVYFRQQEHQNTCIGWTK